MNTAHDRYNHYRKTTHPESPAGSIILGIILLFLFFPAGIALIWWSLSDSDKRHKAQCWDWANRG